ncbi:MAG: UDP binding domain-containing protein, partial [Rubrobacteraceae bacterium]
VHDEMADPEDAARQYDVTLKEWRDLEPAAAVVVAVAHRAYRELSPESLGKLFDGEEPVLADVKGVFDIQALRERGVRVWRL